MEDVGMAKKILGVLAIILGILVMVFPFVSIDLLSFAMGIAVLALGIYWIVKGIGEWKENKAITIFYIILGIFAILFGLVLTGNLPAFEIIVSMSLYILGFLLILGGLVGLLSNNATLSRFSGALFIVLGIVLLGFGYMSLHDPLYVAIVVAIALIVEGLALIKGLQ
jgi:uncharacterized membrane protein HdeD (DUF308 family)